MVDVYSNKSADIEPVMGQNRFETVEIKDFPPVNGWTNGDIAYSDRFISFHNITYTVEQRACFKKQSPKIILNNIRYLVVVYA